MYLLTESIVGLGKTEEWFWESEPRIVIALVEEHKRIERERMKAQGAYIACCVWGKNPDEIDGEKEQEVLGIDRPVDPMLLRGFYG